MKLFKTLDRCMESIGVVLSLVMVAVIFMQVVFRYCLNNALPWPEEMARYLFIWISYLGVAVCMGDDSHLRVTVIPDMFSKRTTASTIITPVNILVLRYFPLPKSSPSGSTTIPWAGIFSEAASLTWKGSQETITTSMQP